MSERTEPRLPNPRTVERSFLLPDLGEGLTDAELLRWHVAVGDMVLLNQVIAEVETAKVTAELPSPYAGRVLTLHAAEGATVDVGAPLITFAVDSPSAERLPAASVDIAGPGAQAGAGAQVSAGAQVGAGTQAEKRVPVLVGYGATSGTTSRRNGRRPASSATSTAAAAAAAAAPQQLRPLAKPLVRKLARDLAVDLTTVHGTGTGGIITRQDVLDRAHPDPSGPLDRGHPHPSGPRDRAHPLPNHAPDQTRPPTERETRIPIRGVRKVTAEAMVRSAFTAPHVTEFVTIDVSATMDLLARLRTSAFADGVRLTMTAFVCSAMVQALRRHPELNASWDEAAQEIVLKHYVNIGIATATPRGLLVPNLKDADRLTLFDLAKALTELTATARDGRCTAADLAGGTISLTNVGVFGVDSGTPILNPGEAAIVCLGAVRQQPWVYDGALAVRWVTTLSLSFDHRLVDGEQGSRFLADVAALLTAG